MADGPTDDQLLAEIQARDGEVNQLLTRQQTGPALMKAIENPPFGTKNPAVKDAAAAVVDKVFAAIRDTDIQGLIDEMDPAACDLVMKYVYRGLGSGANSGSLLKWHAKLMERSGMGCIVRAMTDRKTV